MVTRVCPGQYCEEQTVLADRAFAALTLMVAANPPQRAVLCDQIDEGATAFGVHEYKRAA
jgi:hypothetical protein